MSSVEEGLMTYLTTLVPTAGKGYPLQIPQDVSTGWAYTVVSDNQMIGHGGGLNFYKARIQLDLKAVSTETASAYKVALGLRQLLRAALDGYKGAMGGVDVQFCKTEISDEWADAQESPYTRFDILINYKL
jgi:hypothetical protein